MFLFTVQVIAALHNAILRWTWLVFDAFLGGVRSPYANVFIGVKALLECSQRFL